jgi:hypothetical protein
MARKIYTQNRLDRRLDPAALAPETFEALATELIAELDAEDRDLELADPWSWRRSGGRRITSQTANPLQQFRGEVEDIIVLEREEEARLARRIRLRAHAPGSRQGRRRPPAGARPGPPRGAPPEEGRAPRPRAARPAHRDGRAQPSTSC